MKKETKTYKKPGRLTNEEPLDGNMRKWFEERGIPVEVAEAEGIIKACRKMPQTGNVEKCIVFPYRVEGELLNRKYRDRAQGVTRIHVQKVKFRHQGQPGVASFEYNTHNGRFVPCREGKTPDLPNEAEKYDNNNWLGKKSPKQGELGL